MSAELHNAQFLADTTIPQLATGAAGHFGFLLSHRIAQEEEYL
jgi:hypothetical protein